jgi:hypothetical protein
MQYRLRALLIVLALVIMVMAWVWISPTLPPKGTEAGIFMLSGALAMFVLGILINASEKTAAPLFRFQVRDALWLMVVVLLLCALWIKSERLTAARLHAYDLRLALRHAFHYYHPDKERPPISDVDWTLTDKPIP